MNTYTDPEAVLLGENFDVAYPLENGDNIKSMTRCLIECHPNPDNAIKDFLGGCRALGVTPESAAMVFGFAFEISLKEMPKHINDEEPWKAAIASWRLKIGK